MAIVIATMKEDEALESALIACNSLIGRTYNYKQDVLAKRFLDAMKKGEMLLVAKKDDKVVGFAWIDQYGAFSSAPYLHLLAVDEELRGQRIGSILMEAYEKRTHYVGRDYILLVSDFNEDAIKFYEKLGYVKRGALPDFVRENTSDIIMVKKRAKEIL